MKRWFGSIEIGALRITTALLTFSQHGWADAASASSAARATRMLQQNGRFRLGSARYAVTGGVVKAVAQKFVVKLKGGKLLLAFIPKRGDAIVAAIAVSR